VVLRLGRNNGVFRMKEVSTEDLIAAITGAADNVVTRRRAAREAVTAETA
jgi:D-xylose transport system ATP-binding protein